ncbi:hypothetical protein TSUD_239700 [Trifolium subterraneum]|uniref:Uncharacterized protein n=1 Tax=Trifolium subterraneum TaxID=3900 RepID=A0A2Z6NV17_TRISU|nr:hypothetical protein TSUD_239700 [Trifolium subterraneum]
MHQIIILRRLTMNMKHDTNTLLHYRTTASIFLCTTIFIGIRISATSQTCAYAPYCCINCQVATVQVIDQQLPNQSPYFNQLSFTKQLSLASYNHLCNHYHYTTCTMVVKNGPDLPLQPKTRRKDLCLVQMNLEAV